jgi:hypothetical protein
LPEFATAPVPSATSTTVNCVTAVLTDGASVDPLLDGDVLSELHAAAHTTSAAATNILADDM